MVARCHTIAEPRWSPDGAWIAYAESFDGRADLYVIPAAGGVPVLLTAEPGVTPAASYGGGAYAWAPDGAALVYVAKDGQLHEVAREGGPTRQLTRGPGRFSAPAVSPDGRWVACIATSERTRTSRSWTGRARSGRAGYRAAPTSPSTRRGPRPGRWRGTSGTRRPCPWDAGRIHLAEPNGDLLLVDSGDKLSVGQPRFSPDGRTLAYLCDRTGWLTLWLYDIESATKRPLHRGRPAEHGRPAWGPGQMAFAWSPDGREIAAIRSEAGFVRLQLLDVTAGSSRLVGPEAGAVSSVTWSPQGRRLALLYSRADTPPRLATLDLETDTLTDLLSGAPAGFEAAALPTPEAVTWDTPGRCDGARTILPAGVGRWALGVRR